MGHCTYSACSDPLCTGHNPGPLISKNRRFYEEAYGKEKSDQLFYEEQVRTGEREEKSFYELQLERERRAMRDQDPEEYWRRVFERDERERQRM